VLNNSEPKGSVNNTLGLSGSKSQKSVQQAVIKDDNTSTKKKLESDGIKRDLKNDDLIENVSKKIETN